MDYPSTLTPLRHRCAALAAALAIACAGAPLGAHAGPTSALYLTDGAVGGAVYVVQGGALINSWTGTPDPNAPLDSNPAIAVGETVRTYPSGFVPGAVGAEYSLSGVATGTTYPNLVGCCFRDGATDGVHNYAIRDIIGDNAIYRFSLDWTDPEVIVVPNTFGSINPLGITFDTQTDTFWLVDQGLVYNVTLDGGFLGGFVTGLNIAFTQALAFDPADNTLWLVYSHPIGTIFEQYSNAAGIDSRDPLDSFVLPALSES